MILSNSTLKQIIEENEISISPFDKKNLKPACYVFTLDTKIKIPKTAGFIDSRKSAEFEESYIPEEGFLLNPGAFVVGITKEKVSLHGKYACFVSNRSSLAQMGLSLTLGSTYAEPATDNPFALEIHNVGPNPINLFPGIQIAKGVFLKITN